MPSVFRPKTKSILRLLSINDVYKLDHLPSLKSLFDWSEKVLERKSRGPDGGEIYKFHVCRTLAGDFLSPNILSPVDSGQGFMRCFNNVGITHFCFGNHEGNFSLDVLNDRIAECKGVFLNSNIPTLSHPNLSTYDVVNVGPHKIGIIGLLSNEKKVFRNQTFKGHKIEDVVEKTKELEILLREKLGCKHVIAMTHQSIENDRLLAESCNLTAIIGGHEHSPFDETVAGCRILKSGKDSEYCGILDLIIDPKGNSTIEYHLEPVPLYPPEANIQEIVDRCLEEVAILENEILITSETPVIAKGPRFRPTELATLICEFIREEMNSDIAVINGATIKASKDFPKGRISYADLRLVLPFPTKMVVVDVPGSVIQQAIQYSRTNGVHSEEKRGFLQVSGNVHISNPTISGPFGNEQNEKVSDTIESVGSSKFNPEKVYAVALPRNLMTGFCGIKPLVSYIQDNPARMPDSDVFIPAFDLVIQRCSKKIWQQLGSFSDISKMSDTISRKELRRHVEKELGRAYTTDHLIDQLMQVGDLNGDGKISNEEFNAIVHPSKPN